MYEFRIFCIDKCLFKIALNESNETAEKWNETEHFDRRNQTNPGILKQALNIYGMFLFVIENVSIHFFK